MLNSCLGLFTAACFRRHPFFRSYGVNMPSSLTTLLPLALGSSPHLPVSVCGTGALYIPYAFSRRLLRLLPVYFRSLTTHYSSSGLKLCIRVSILKYFSGYGISTVCASTTPFGLALAPGLPRADEPTPGNLRFSAITILTQFSLLIPAFSLLYSPHVLPIMLRPVQNAPLPHPLGILSFGYTLSPVKSSAQHHSTSELLRTL